MSKIVAVIDGNSLMHRAYHAVPPTMNAPDGTPTNAVFGFMSMLLKFIDMEKPDALVCAFDAGRPAWRMEAIKEYKAQRPPMDTELKVQFPLIEKLLEAMNVAVVRIKGWEGDDILGTVAARDEELGYMTLLVSGDKDVYQLVSERTHVVTTKRGISDVAIYGPEEVEERYGVTPEQFPDFLGLKGDASDNIPGVPGVGDKTAAKLLQQFGSLEGIYENLDALKGKQLERLRDNKQAAFASRQVATIVRDLDFPLDLEACAFPSFDIEVVTAAFSEIHFNSHLGRLLKLVGKELDAPCAEISWEPVCRGEEARALIERALEEMSATADAQGAQGATADAQVAPADAQVAPADTTVDATHAISTTPYIGVAFVEPEQASLFDNATIAAFSTAHGTALFENDEALEVASRLIKCGAFASLDTKELIHRVYPADSGACALVTEKELLAMRAFDLGLAAYVLNSSQATYTYDELLNEYLSGVLPKTKTDEERACACAAAARMLVTPLARALKEQAAEYAYFEIDLPLVPHLAIMERTGAALDCKRLAELGRTTEAELERLREQIYEMAGETFNIDSPMQLSHILFEVLGLTPTKKTQRGYSTDAGVLKELSKVHELPVYVLRYRELAKIKSTYIDALPRDAARANDKRVHTTFNETVTTTGRLSSSDPNLQNIPVRTDFGKQIRECFVPLALGELFLSADYSQIELRLLAHLSEDEHLIEAFCSGADFHASTASHVFGVPIDEVTPQLRSRAKAVNFGIVYGQQAFGLAQSLDIPFAEAKEMIERYFEAYPGVRTYLDETIAHAKECGYAETMHGRRRHILEINAKNASQRGFGERTAMNHPMQGSAADIIKIAMARVQKRLIEEGFSAKLLLQVHDELDFSVPECELESLSALVREVMENVEELRVPLVVDVSWGKNWAEAH